MTAPAPRPPVRGLDSAEAAARLRRDGPNLLPQADRRQWPALVWGVLREPMLLLLLAASGLYVLLGDPREAALLGLSVLLVVAMTVHQEYKSERALQALRELGSPRAHVLRDGALQVLPAGELVVGDVVSLEEGDRVPADARLLEDVDLHVDESMLTGESIPVRRSAAAREPAERTVYAGTLLVRGRGLAEVQSTGRATEMGRIGASLAGIGGEPTGIQREMRRVVLQFATLGLASAVGVVLLYGWRSGEWLNALLAGVALAMANIPEEFPVVLTIFLALGAWRMAKHNALVRRAAAIEALGAVTVLCTDKTGTLTQNRMAVAELVAGDEHAAPSPGLSPRLRELLEHADLASQDIAHDPMEHALRASASQAGCARGERRAVHDYALTDDLLAITRVWSVPGRDRLAVASKGAPEAIAALCGLPDAIRDSILAEVAAMAGRGLRVIAVARGDFPGDAGALPLSPRSFAMQWLGLVGLADPLRAGVAGAVAEARGAGVRVLMLTGDHPQTAREIARQAGIGDGADPLPGRELETLEGEALLARARATDVYARVRPEQKLRLVRALRQGGDVVAMTGDGVNDAPALRAAHVGIAMGQRGSDVARESAAIVLLDDDFVTVVGAIRLGRAIYANIRRAVRYIVAVHVPITGLALLPLLLGEPLVLLPLHLVFMELIIDPSSSIVFEREAPDADLMRRPPRPASQRLLDLRTLSAGLGQGALSFLAVLAVYLHARGLGLPPAQLGALAFTALVVGNLALIALNRPGDRLWTTLRRRNRAFWIVVASAAAVLFVVTRFEGPASWFRFAPAPAGLVVLAVLAPVAAIAAWDLFGRRRRQD